MEMFLLPFPFPYSKQHGLRKMRPVSNRSENWQRKPFQRAIRQGNPLVCRHSSTGVCFSATMVRHVLAIPQKDLTSLTSCFDRPANNTTVYGTKGYCTETAPSSEVGCTTWHGRQYNIQDSLSRKGTIGDDYPTDRDPYPEMDLYTNAFTIHDDLFLEDLPVGVPLQDWAQQGCHPVMALGLGDNSTILRALRAGNHIASRTWSTLFGWTGGSATSQQDGTFVFSRYDRAKVDGQGYTYDLSQDERCSTQFLAVINDIILQFLNGTEASLVRHGIFYGTYEHEHFSTEFRLVVLHSLIR